MIRLKIWVVVLFVVCITMSNLLYGNDSTLYIVPNWVLSKEKKTLIEDLKKFLEENNTDKKFTEVKILEKGKKPDDLSKSGDYYVFLYGWRYDSGKSTLFFSSDGDLRYYSPMAKNNAFLLIMIPLDQNAYDKLAKERYLISFPKRQPEDVKFLSLAFT